MKEKKLSNFKNLPYFTLESLKSQFKENPLPVIKYNLKVGKLLRLKRGIYVWSDYWEKLRYAEKGENYLEFIANKLILPSYLSAEYVLGKYSVLSEAPSSFTSVTKKTSRFIENKLGNFSYFSIKESLFTGFELKKKSEFFIFESTKAKALFDFLYFKKRLLNVVNRETAAELRLNIEEFSNDEYRELKKYLKLAKSVKLNRICELLFEK